MYPSQWTDILFVSAPTTAWFLAKQKLLELIAFNYDSSVIN